MKLRLALMILAVATPALAQRNGNLQVQEMNFDIWCQQQANLPAERCDKRTDQDNDQPPPPPPPPPSLRAHPKAPYLRLVVSQDSPAFLHFGSGDLLQKMFEVIGRWRAANSEDYSRFV